MTGPESHGEDASGILAWLDEKPSLSRHVAAARQLEELHRTNPDLFETRRLLIVRNYTIEPIDPFVKIAGYRRSLHLSIEYTGYDPGPEDLSSSALFDAAIVTIRLEDLSSALSSDFLTTEERAALEISGQVVDHVGQLVDAVLTSAARTVLVHNFVAPLSPSGGLSDWQNPVGQTNLVRRMNLQLAEMFASQDGVYLMDVDHLFAQVGLREAFDRRGARLSGAPLSQASLQALAEAQVRFLVATRGPKKKCVVVDCDNTLWGGVIGEDGLSGIVLGETGVGRRYRDFQTELLNLRRRGVVLAIASKNETADVEAVLTSHPDCVLSLDDFSAFRINWEDKARNIESIAKELNLGLAHLAFFDDNPAECEWVRSQLPAVSVIQVPDELPTGSLDDLELFDALSLTDEDRNRTQMYRAEGDRKSAREEAGSYQEYLHSLEMTAVLGTAQPQHLARLAQLTQRTNQFNLTTRRYAVPDLMEMKDDPLTSVCWLELRDRFGGHGTVGCGIVRVDGDTARIDTLLLSCRVLGRGVENVLVHRLAVAASDLGATKLVGEFMPSERNGQVADLYTRLGFQGPESEGKGQIWWSALDLNDLAVPSWFQVVDADLGGQ